MSEEPEYELVSKNKFKNIIKVIGVGGAGCNAVKHMHNMGVSDIGLVICNTDQQALESASPEIKRLQIGIELTKGLGAGTEPEMGRKAAEESEKAIREMLKEPTEMVFITAGMGGGTGTGAAPVIARIAREMKLLTVAVVTDPFTFEGEDKILQARAGIEELKKCSDTVLIIKNERLEQTFGDMDIEEAYAKADDVLANGVKSIAELITRPGIINLDFADVKKVLGNAGQAVMGTAEAEGERRAEEAIKLALSSPLLESNDINGAQRVLLSIAYSPEHKIKLSDQTLVTKFVESQIQTKARLFKHGFAIDKNLGKKVRVTIVAAGYENVPPPFEIDIPQPPVMEVVRPMHVAGPTATASNAVPLAVATAASSTPPTPQVVATGSASSTQYPSEESPNPNFIEQLEPKVEQKDPMEQIRAMIQRFMREGYRNPALNTTPTYVRNGIELQDVKKLRQNGKVLEYELDQLLSMMESSR
ncbi:cell division protein FtsZ [Emticicia oligotrophica DSM 17448]|uniref:Cell division protein FtsZ n=1 Tax=Emticicia oligotrophica (strain DSM 17448 / CIP 109782 / MTCC 6937 / GPTSA100-15) TaxID=929562 RepID=A0ABN4AL31_EMTOG|nr:cell division protein FtsZ [Emticicia oligotrophica]AFK02976.1 cell division protein FtsZ [Emticicia oligotrophica DSM 17448]